MRFRIDRFGRTRIWLTLRAWALLLVGGLGIVVTSFVTLLGVAITLFGGEPNLLRRAPFLVLTVFGGLVPLGLSAFAFWRGLSVRRALRRLCGVATLAARIPSISSQDVVEGLGVSRDDAERAALDAAEAGLVEDDARDLAQVAPAALSGVRRTRLARPPEDVVACIGAVLNDTYRIEAHIGSGAMGTVYAARHLRTGRSYAVKMIRPDASAPADLLRRFEREATAAGVLDHPNIVPVHDYDRTEDGVHYLVMELLRGETLEQRLAREGSLPFQEARRVALELGSALHAAHSAGLLHRDLKPANVFLAHGPARAVLLDFGLVKRLDEAGMLRLTRSGAVVGTPLYMSPEQARGEPLDVRSDVYGLAALLYEMTTGEPPFMDCTLAGVYARLLKGSVRRPSSLCPVPAGVDALLDRGLSKQREARFGNVLAFADALARVG